MKYGILGLILVSLVGCGKEPNFTDGKTLYDKTGCAFIAVKNVGDTVFLRFNQDLSKETCKYEELSK